MDAFLSEENRPMKPVIESPVNGTLEVDVGKCTPVRMC